AASTSASVPRSPVSRGASCSSASWRGPRRSPSTTTGPSGSGRPSSCAGSRAFPSRSCPRSVGRGRGGDMSVTSHATPIKLGVLTDLVIPKTPERDVWRDMVETVEFVFREALEAGELDRPVELLVREADGLPTGTVKSVIDAYRDLVDDGCLAVFGPNISENTIPLRTEIERRFEVPAISLCGADEWLG